MPPKSSLSEMIAQKRKAAKMMQEQQQQQQQPSAMLDEEEQSSTSATPFELERQELLDWFNNTSPEQQRQSVVVAFDDLLTRSHISPNGRYPERPNRLTRSVDLLRDFMKNNSNNNNAKKNLIRFMPQLNSMDQLQQLQQKDDSNNNDDDNAKKQRLDDIKSNRDLLIASNPVLLSIHTSPDFRNFILNNKPFPTVSTDLFFDVDENNEKLGSLVAARRAASLTIEATLGVWEERWKHAFALVRPPGHHSGCDKCHGFCLINNVGAAVGALLEKEKQKNTMMKKTRIAIVDIDVHHGDGTQQICDLLNKRYRDDGVEILFFSLHRYDQGKFFPQTGHPESIGEFGLNLNLGFDTFCAPSVLRQMKLDRLKKQEEEQKHENPENQNEVHQESSKPPTIEQFPIYKIICDESIKVIMDEFLMPLLNQAFASPPDLTIVSCGFDAAEGDPLGGQGVTKNGYRYIFDKLSSPSLSSSSSLEGDRKKVGKVVGVLEGGYDVEIVSNNFLEVVKTLAASSGENKESTTTKMQVPKHFENGRRNFGFSDDAQVVSDEELIKMNREWTRETIRELCRKYCSAATNQECRNENILSFMKSFI